jgi:hypothetical protein
LLFNFKNLNNTFEEMRKFSILQIRRFLELKKDSKKERAKIIPFFTFPVLDSFVNLFSESNDYIEFNELLIILINLTYLDSKFIDYFLKDNFIFEKLFKTFNNVTENELLYQIAENILLLLGNFFSRPKKLENILKIIPFQESLSMLMKNIKTLPNYLVNNLLWAFGKAIKNLPKTFENYITPELLETTVKQAEYYIEQDLCFEAFSFLEDVTELKNENLNDFLINKLNLLEIVLNYIKKNYDFEITARCLCVLLNLSQCEKSENKIFCFFKAEVFWVSLDQILIDINDNFDKYSVEHLKLFLEKLLKIFKNFLLELDERFLISKTNENAIELNLMFIVTRANSDKLVYNYLRYTRKKLRSNIEFKVFCGFISIGFLQFLLGKVFEEYKDDMEIIQICFYILEKFFEFEKKFKNKLITNALIKFNAYAIIDKMRESFNDKIAEQANSIFEYLDY